MPPTKRIHVSPLPSSGRRSIFGMAFQKLGLFPRTRRSCARRLRADPPRSRDARTLARVKIGAEAERLPGACARAARLRGRRSSDARSCRLVEPAWPVAGLLREERRRCSEVHGEAFRRRGDSRAEFASRRSSSRRLKASRRRLSARQRRRSARQRRRSAGASSSATRGNSRRAKASGDEVETLHDGSMSTRAARARSSARR